LLEIGIIVCVALILFVLLRHFPQTKDRAIMPQERRSNMKVAFLENLWRKRRKKTEEDIKKSLLSGQEEIVTPAEVETAKKSFWTVDPAVAKLLHEADEALRASNFDVAEKKALQAISHDKKADQAYVFVARVAFERNEYNDATEACLTALRLNDENAYALALLGEINLVHEKYSLAITYFQKAINLDRNQAEWQAGLGKCYLMVRQFAKAAKALRRAAMLDIENKEYHRLADEAEEKQKTHSQVLRLR